MSLNIGIPVVGGAGIDEDVPAISPIGLICKIFMTNLLIFYNPVNDGYTQIINPKHIVSITKIVQKTYTTIKSLEKHPRRPDIDLIEDKRLNGIEVYTLIIGLSDPQYNINLSFMNIENSLQKVIDKKLNPQYKPGKYFEHFPSNQLGLSIVYYDDKDFTLMNSLIELICSKM
jgi:hypothetical protein